MPEPAFDVFLSYSWADRELAVALAEELNGHGLLVFRDERQIDEYDEIAPEIEAGLAGSRSLLALYSPEFPRSAYCRWELYAALTRAYRLDRHTQRVMATLHGVAYGDVRPRRLAAVRLPAPSSSISAVAEAVAAKLDRVDQRPLGPHPSSVEPRWYPAPREQPRRFEGRAAELWDIHDALSTSDPAEQGGAPVLRVVGLGGLGKTMLVEEYARRFGLDYPGGVFLHVFASARAVAPPVHEDRPYLWIVDDLPSGVDSEAFRSVLAPTPAGRTLMTTREADEHLGGAVLHIGELAPVDAVHLLTSRRPAQGGERRIVRQLAVDDLGGHPQALDLAAAMATDPEFAGYAALRAAIADPDRDALQLAAELRGELPGGHAAGIAVTLSRSTERLSRAGRDVLRLFSLLAAAPVPVELLADAVTRVDGTDDTIAAGLAEAEHRGLARRLQADRDPLWTVHTMVSRTVRFTDPAGPRRAELGTALFAALVDRLDQARDDQRFAPVAAYLPHVDAVARQADEVEGWYARNEAGRAFAELGRYGDAQALFEALVATCRARLGEHDPTTLAVLSALAVVTGLRGQHQRALQLKTEAYEGLAATLGVDHPDAVTALNNLAVTQLERHEPAAARELAARAYWARRRALGPHHTETLTALGNLAAAAGAMRRHRLAVRLRTVVHTGLSRLYGRSHPLTLEALNNLGSSRRKIGDQAGAATAFAEVLAGRQAQLGPEHPQTYAALANLAIVGDPELAVDQFDEAYRGLVSHHDPGAPITLTVLANLLLAQIDGPAQPAPATTAPPADLDLTVREELDANTDDRVALFERAERVHAALVERRGPDDPATMVALTWVAQAAAVLGQLDHQLDVALVFATDAADGLRERLGANHPDAVLAERIRSWIEDEIDDRTG